MKNFKVKGGLNQKSLGTPGTDYVAPNGMMITNDELEVMWKEAVVTYFRYYPSIWLEGLKQ
jgi:hypothetical protein